MPLLLELLLLINFAIGPSALAEEAVLKGFISRIHPNSLHPFDNSDAVTYNQINQIFDTLVTFDENGNIVPALAESWKWLDTTTLEMKLRKEVTFHDGEALDSQSVQFTFELFTSPKLRIENRQYADTIRQVIVVDSHTVHIKTSKPDSFLVQKLATVGHIIPKKRFLREGHESFSKKPVGTGPFQFVHSDFKTKLVLRKNPKYWHKPPEIDQLELHYLPNFDVALDLFKKGEIHFISHFPGNLTKHLIGLENITVSKQLTYRSIQVLLNTMKKDSPLKNREFRKALWKAIDFEEIVRYQDEGNGKTTTSLSLAGEAFFNPTIPKVIPSFKQEPSLLRAKSYPFKMLVSEPLGLVGEMVAKQIQDKGIQVEAQFGNSLDGAAHVLNHKLKGTTPEIDFLVSYCSHPYPAFPYLIMLASRGNWSLTQDPILDRMIEDASSDFDPVTQQRKFLKITQYVHDEALLFPGYQFRDIYVHDGRFEFHPHPTGYIFFKYAKLRGKAL